MNITVNFSFQLKIRGELENGITIDDLENRCPRAMFYNPKGGYKFVLCGKTIKERIASQMWYGVRDTRGSITIMNDRVLKQCEYLGKSKGFDDLFETKEEQ